MKNYNAFVFALCGAREHIDYLHIALKALKRRTTLPIYVVTDCSRNEIPIEHNCVIDVCTPKEYTHHQAAIFLKTSIHRYINIEDHIFCYLDTDVIAVGEKVEAIFKEFKSPISFAKDHCVLNEFSSYAVHCDCRKTADIFNKAFMECIDDLDEFSLLHDCTIKKNRISFFNFIERSKSTVTRYLKYRIKFFLPFRKIYFADNIILDRQLRCWVDNFGNPYMRLVSMKQVACSLNLKWNFIFQRLETKDGKNIWRYPCNHLKEAIKDKFNVPIQNDKWHHYNGGVFLFSNESIEFLEAWHKFTLAIFEDRYWKVRDQGTLIATTWLFNLQKHSTLPSKWNCIVDDSNPQSIPVKIKAELLHIFNRIGDDSWFFWQRIKHLISDE